MRAPSFGFLRARVALYIPIMSTHFSGYLRNASYALRQWESSSEVEAPKRARHYILDIRLPVLGVSLFGLVREIRAAVVVSGFVEHFGNPEKYERIYPLLVRHMPALEHPQVEHLDRLPSLRVHGAVEYGSGRRLVFADVILPHPSARHICKPCGSDVFGVGFALVRKIHARDSVCVGDPPRAIRLVDGSSPALFYVLGGIGNVFGPRPELPERNPRHVGLYRRGELLDGIRGYVWVAQPLELVHRTSHAHNPNELPDS